MKKFMYWLWNVAEHGELGGWFPAPFWSWLMRRTDEYHGYTYDSQGYLHSGASLNAQQAPPTKH